MRTALLAIAAAAALALPAAAQTPAAEPPMTLVYAGTLLDRPGQAPRRNVTVAVRDGRVVAVTPGFTDPATISSTRNVTVIDLRDRFVLPGLIDSHVHLTSDRAGQEGALAGFTDTPALSAYEAAWNARKTLEAGFTTVRNLGSGDGVTLALRDAVAKGWTVGPRIVDAGAGISATTGHGDPTLGFREEFHAALSGGNLCDGPEECRRAVRRQISFGADVIKIMTTGGVNSRIGLGLGAQMFDDEVKALVDTARLYGRKVAVHAHGDDGARMAVQAGAHSIEHGTMLTDETLRLMRQKGTYYVPTLSTVNGYLERIARDPNAYSPEVREKIDWRIRITGEALRQALPHGVKIAFGTDAGVSKHGRNADEFELMVKHGMTPATAIHAATVNAADLLGLSDQVGTLEPGKRADLIAVAGDPLQDVTLLKRVEFVMKDGRVHKAAR